MCKMRPPQLCPRPCLWSFCIYICKGLQGGSAVTLLLSLHPLPSPSPLKYQIWIVCLHFEPNKLTLATIPALLLILTEFQMTVIVHSRALCLMSGGKWLTNGTLLLIMLLFCKLFLKILSFALTFSNIRTDKVLCMLGIVPVMVSSTVSLVSWTTCLSVLAFL